MLMFRNVAAAARRLITKKTPQTENPPETVFLEISSDEESAPSIKLSLKLLTLVDLPKNSGMDLEISVGEAGDSFERQKSLGGWALVDGIKGDAFICTDLSRAPHFNLEISSLVNPQVTFRLVTQKVVVSEGVLRLRGQVGIVSTSFSDSVSAVSCLLGVGDSLSICYTHRTHSQLTGSVEALADLVEANLKTLTPKQASDWLEGAPLLTSRGVWAGVRRRPELRARLECLAAHPDLSAAARARLLGGVGEDWGTAENLACGGFKFPALRNLLGFSRLSALLENPGLRKRVLETIQAEGGRNFQVVTEGVVTPGLRALAEMMQCKVQTGVGEDWERLHADCTVLRVGGEATSLALDCFREGWLTLAQMQELGGLSGMSADRISEAIGLQIKQTSRRRKLRVTRVTTEGDGQEVKTEVSIDHEGSSSPVHDFKFIPD